MHLRLIVQVCSPVNIVDFDQVLHASLVVLYTVIVKDLGKFVHLQLSCRRLRAGLWFDYLREYGAATAQPMPTPVRECRADSSLTNRRTLTNN